MEMDIHVKAAKKQKKKFDTIDTIDNDMNSMVFWHRFAPEVKGNTETPQYSVCVFLHENGK